MLSTLVVRLEVLPFALFQPFGEFRVARGFATSWTLLSAICAVSLSAMMAFATLKFYIALAPYGPDCRACGGSGLGFFAQVWADTL